MSFSLGLFIQARISISQNKIFIAFAGCSLVAFHIVLTVKWL